MTWPVPFYTVKFKRVFSKAGVKSSTPDWFGRASQWQEIGPSKQQTKLSEHCQEKKVQHFPSQLLGNSILHTHSLGERSQLIQLKAPYEKILQILVEIKLRLTFMQITMHSSNRKKCNNNRKLCHSWKCCMVAVVALCFRDHPFSRYSRPVGELYWVFHQLWRAPQVGLS